MKIFFLLMSFFFGITDAYSVELSFKYPTVSYDEFKNQKDKKLFFKNLINEIDSAWENKNSIICKDVVNYKLINEMQVLVHFQVKCAKAKDNFLVMIPYSYKSQPLVLECKVANKKLIKEASCRGKL